MRSGAHSLTDADLAIVRRVWDTMAAATKANDWERYRQHLTQDHVTLDPRIAGPLRGIAAWRAWLDSVDPRPEIRFTVEEVSGSGDVAYIVWTFGEGWTEGTEQMEAQGKGLSIFQRETDEAWRMSHSAWNSNP